jgi:CelD/BcsL family acetyltransferase involved in cellulose biosynthesis
VRVEVIHPQELGAAGRAAWTRMRQSNPNLASPYFSLGFSEAVASSRPDIRVAVIEDNEAIVGFLGVQGKSRFAAMALGAPISDYQGFVAAPDQQIDFDGLFKALRVGRVDFTHLPTDQANFASVFQGASPTWVANLRQGKAAYLERIKTKRYETLRQQDRKRRKLEREVPQSTYTAASKAREHLETLLEWKTEQCRRTGQPLVWAAPWVRQTVDAAFYAEDPDFRGILFTLSDGPKLIAAHFNLVSGNVMHAWLIGHHPDYEQYSPGVLITRFLVEWAADNGFVEVDFGPGDYRYKREFGEPGRELGWGYAGRPSVSASIRAIELGGRRIVEAVPITSLAAIPGKIMRRLDVMRGLAAPSS